MDHETFRGSKRFTARERVARDINGAGPPLQPWAAELLESRLRADERGQSFAANHARCLPSGLPLMMFTAVDGPIQIIESQDQVTILSTEMNEQWLIYLNAKHRADLDPSYHGDSVGHWEGSTLVVDSIGIGGDKTTIDESGTPHSDELHVVTRLRRTGPNDIEVRVWMEDPKAFLRPWEQKVLYHRSAPGTRIDEYVCEINLNAPDANGFQGFHMPPPRQPSK